jgi:hypothetical protein
VGTPDGKKGAAVKEERAVSLRALARSELLQLLQQSGSKLATPEALAGDEAAGLPANGDGTFNLMTVAAWLVREPKT